MLLKKTTGEMIRMRKKNKVRVLVTILFMTFLLLGTCGCSKSVSNNSGDPERKEAERIKEENQAETIQAETEQSETVPVESVETEYPLTITTYDGKGNEVTTTYEKAPDKVLAVYQGCIETMLALGLEDHLIATAGLDNEVPDDRKAAFSKVDYLDEFTPSLETVTMLEPDMIFSWGSLFRDKNLGDASAWIEKGTNIYINTNTRPDSEEAKTSRNLENEYTDILNIGKIFNVQDKAQAIVDGIQEVIDNTVEVTADMEEKPTALIIESYDETFTNYGASSLGGDMLKKLGGVLANPDGSDMGKEDIINLNPDVIFVVYMPYAGDDPEQVKQDKLNVILADDAFKSLDAVKNGRVVPIMLSEMYASATRTQDGVQTLAKGLFPELTIE